MIISNIDREIKDLSYIVGTVSDHILIIGDSRISLRDTCGKNSSVRFIYK